MKNIQCFKTLFRSASTENRFFYKDENKDNPAGKIIKKLRKSRAVLLFGPAGHGKSYSLKKVINIYQRNGQLVKILCPTWKAIEVYEHKNITSTIESIRRNNRKTDFFENLDLLVIDEMTLISYWDFVERINDNTKIIIAGDFNQLKPIMSKVIKARWLLEISDKSNQIDLTKRDNWRISESKNKEIMQRQLKLMAQGKINLKRNNHNFHFCSTHEELFSLLKNLSELGFRIITRTNRGIFCVDFLNRFLGDKKAFDFSSGDEIVFIKNENSSPKRYYNGMFGKILNIFVRNDWKIYEIKTIRGSKINVCCKDDPPFSRCYAINAHKCQGSTIEKVAVLVVGKINYSWLYTAFSRASIDAKIIFWEEFN